MKKIVLITGANGMLAKSLGKRLEAKYTVRYLTRKVSRDNHFLWDIEKGYVDPKALTNLHTIIHLAGASIAEKRWTYERKQTLISSRIESALLLLKSLKENNIILESFISASAIGYYGTQTTDNIYKEESPKGNDFLSKVCDKWEDAALQFKKEEIAHRVAIFRIGIILSKVGGALDKIVKPIRFGLGAPLGTGKQYMPWIHIDDLSGMINYMMDTTHLNGIYNAVAPHHVTNKEMTSSIAEVIRKPLLLPNIPQWFIKVLFGQMGDILLFGSRVSCEKIQNMGFEFKYESLKAALHELIQQ